MPPLDRYRASQDARNNLRVVDVQAAPADTSVGDAVSAIGELGMRIAAGRAQAEAADLEVEARKRYDAAYRELEADGEDNGDQFESRMVERSREIRGELLDSVKSGTVRKMFDERLNQIEGGYIIETRNLSRKRQVDGLRASVFESATKLEKTALDKGVPIEADPDRPHLPSFDGEAAALRAKATSMMRNGIIGKEDYAKLDAQVIALREAKDSDWVLDEVDALVEAGDIAAAEEFFKVNYGRILPAQREAAEKAFEAQTLEAKSIQIADQLWDEAGQNYGEFIALSAKIKNPAERTAVEARGARMHNERDAAKSQKQRIDLEEGMSYVVAGKSPPREWMMTADPDAVYTVQERLQARREQSLRIAGMTAAEKAAAEDNSKMNLLRLQSQLTDPALVMAGRRAILADPQMKALYDNLLPDEQRAFEKTIIDAQANDGMTTDKTLKAYRDVVALVGVYMPEGLSAKKFEGTFKGAGEGDAGTRRVSANRNKSDAAIELEGEIMRLVEEEIRRTGSSDIPVDRAKQIVALGFANAGKAKDGSVKYPPSADVATGIAATDARQKIIAFRQSNPQTWARATQMVRAQYPEAPDEIILEEALKLESALAVQRTMDAVSGFFGSGEDDQ